MYYRLRIKKQYLPQNSDRGFVTYGINLPSSEEFDLGHKFDIFREKGIMGDILRFLDPLQAALAYRKDSLDKVTHNRVCYFTEEGFVDFGVDLIDAFIMHGIASLYELSIVEDVEDAYTVDACQILAKENQAYQDIESWLNE